MGQRKHVLGKGEAKTDPWWCQAQAAVRGSEILQPVPSVLLDTALSQTEAEWDASKQRSNILAFSFPFSKSLLSPFFLNSK